MPTRRAGFSGPTGDTPRYRPKTDTYDAGACQNTGCGQPPTAGRHPAGTVTVRVHGSTVPESWYCSGRCASRGMAYAELHMGRIPPAESAAARAIRQLADGCEGLPPQEIATRLGLPDVEVERVLGVR